MKLFLIIVGALVTAFVLCLLILVLWLRWLTRNVRRSLGKLGDVLEQARPSVPPLRIKLRRTDAIHWQRPDEVDALIEPLRQERFAEIGTFGFATDTDDVAMQAFWRPADSVYAIVYQHPRANSWLDLVTRYQDGSTSPPEAFARWNAAVGNERRYEKIGQLAQPLAADVYLSPNSDD